MLGSRLSAYILVARGTGFPAVHTPRLVVYSTLGRIVQDTKYITGRATDMFGDMEYFQSYINFIKSSVLRNTFFIQKLTNLAEIQLRVLYKMYSHTWPIISKHIHHFCKTCDTWLWRNFSQSFRNNGLKNIFFTALFLSLTLELYRNLSFLFFRKKMFKSLFFLSAN
jgi:hypothetical protein